MKEHQPYIETADVNSVHEISSYFHGTLDMGTGANGPARMRFSDDSGIAGWVKQSDRTAVIPDVSNEKTIYKKSISIS
jgi:hypothetical protein